MDNKEIQSTESVQANSNISSNDKTQELFRELIKKFDGLNTRLTNIETNTASIKTNIMTELNGVKRDLATFKNSTSRDRHEIKFVNR